MGPVALLLAAAGALAKPRETWVFTLIGLLVTWLSFGVGVQPSLWSLLNRVPVLGSLRGPERLILFVTLCLALLAGFGLQAGKRALESRWRLGPGPGRALSVGVLLAMTLPMLMVNAPISRTAFIVPPPSDLRDAGWFSARAPRPPFRQARFPRNPLQWGAPVWEPVLRNRGNVIGETNIPMQRAAVPQGSPGYRGEAFLQNRNGRVSAEITPIRIRVRAHVTEADHLVINQNFFPGWRVEGTALGPPTSFDGRLSLWLPSGEHEITLYFRPRGALVGGVVTLASSALCVLLLLRTQRARRA